MVATEKIKFLRKNGQKTAKMSDFGRQTLRERSGSRHSGVLRLQPAV